MNTIKFDPFFELRGIHNEMNRLFNRELPERGEFTKGAWSPSVDIYEDQNKLILEAELPGLDRDDFELSVENNVLTLKGERRFEKKADGDNYHRVERSYGSFVRQFTLPQTVTADGATADFENGILRVALAKREETKARKIEVTGSFTEAKAIEAETKAAAA